MSDKERVRRPVLERTKPIRNWATVVSPAPQLESPLGPDLQNANRVLEEQMRAGEASARLFQNVLGSRAGGGDSLDAQRLLRAWLDFSSFWIDFMTRSVATGGKAQTTERATESGAEPRETTSDPAVSEPFRVAVEIDSVRPARVTVDLRLRAKDSTLHLDRLQPHGSSAPPITGTEISVSPEDRLVIIRLRVDSEQPPGVYNGVIVEESTSLPVGTISVDVRPARDRSPFETRT